MINQDNNSIESVAKCKNGTTSLKMEQLANGDMRFAINIKNFEKEKRKIMNIKIGEYVKTYSGIIGKVVDYCNDEYYIKISEEQTGRCTEDFIKSHSKKIEDLEG